MHAEQAAPVRAGRRADIKVMVFDTFGTVVDWRGTIISEGVALSTVAGLGSRLDAPSDRLHHCAVVQWKHQSHDEHGKVCWAPVGLHPKELGIRTAYVYRLYEGGTSDTGPKPAAETYDYIVNDLLELAVALGT